MFSFRFFNCFNYAKGYIKIRSALCMLTAGEYVMRPVREILMYNHN